MLRKLVILFILLLSGGVLSSENLFTYYVGRYVDILSAVPTSEGGAILTGSLATVERDREGLIFKLSKAGRVEWKTLLGGKKEDYFQTVAELKDGTYVAAGLTSTFVSPRPFYTSDILIVRFDTTGKILWRKTIGGSNSDYAVSATATQDGGVVLLSFTNSFRDPDPLLDTFSDFLILKLSASGKILWSLKIAAPGDDHPVSSIELKDGSILIGGYGDGFKLIRINQSGKILWSRRYNELLIFESMTQLLDGNILLSGWEKDTSQIILTKINPSGTVVWSRRLTAANQNLSFSTVTADDIGGVFVAVQTLDDRTLFLRINRSGNIQWKTIFDIANSEYPVKMIRLMGGDILFMGSAYDFQGIPRSSILKFSQSGEMISCYSEVPSVQLKGVKIHSEKLKVSAKRNIRFRVTSPRLVTTNPNLPFDTICP